MSIESRASDKLRQEFLTIANPGTTSATANVILKLSVKFFNPGKSTTANAISMTVQTLNADGTFVAERPEYYNTASVSSFVVQGGTNIIGFCG